MQIEIGQIFTQMLAFLIMLLILKKFAWKPLLNLLEERKGKIQSEFETIESQKKELARLMESYKDKFKEAEEFAKTKLQEEIGKGRAIAQEIEEDSRKRAKEILIRAEADIAREISRGKTELKNELVKLVTLSTEKMLMENLNPEKKRELSEKLAKEIEFK